MPKKISITFVFTMVFAVVALFTATQVLAEPKIKTLGSHIIIELPGGAAPRSVYYELKRSGNDFSVLKVNGLDITDDEDLQRKFEHFRFCYEVEDQNSPPPDAIQIPASTGKWFSCHQPKEVTNEAGFVSNPRSCPVFINPPGIWVDPCK